LENSDIDCGVCGLTFNNMNEAKAHMMGHLKMFSCVFCGTQYNSLVRLSTHMWMKHLNSEYKCQHCKDSVFESYFDFKLHIKNDCKAKKFGCTHCGKCSGF
jgi:DNA-directed RNA polymerase subunit RPC12/RpoP